MFTKEDIARMEADGRNPAQIRSQVERLRKGFPWLDVVAPATPGNGIEVLSESEASQAAEYGRNASVAGRLKFVPASGAASRMFKDIFAGAARLKAGESLSEDAPLSRLASRIEDFAFYTPEDFPDRTPLAVAEELLSDTGLGYGSKPKGVLKFHRYPDEVRTALAEHLVEGSSYMRNSDGSVKLVVTVSPEHLPLFKQALEDVRETFEKRYSVRYDVEFTFQDKATDTIAVDSEGKPFRKNDGTLLFRPAGHGALLGNLSAVDAELVSVKNIDNVAVERMLPTTAFWKEVLAGRALQLRDRIFGYIYALDQIASASPTQVYPSIPGITPADFDPFASDEAQALCNEIELFLRDVLCVTIPAERSPKARAAALRKKLDRPIRVCGMVRNQGEPGGGPFIIRASDGSTSLQILESVQLREPLGGTHFNPVDLVCCLLDSQGRHFRLEDYVDPQTGFISSKSFEGRELKALELPGLWNGSMSDWNTLFVEVPVETFNPVKTVLDLLRPAHQA